MSEDDPADITSGEWRNLNARINQWHGAATAFAAIGAALSGITLWVVTRSLDNLSYAGQKNAVQDESIQQIKADKISKAEAQAMDAQTAAMVKDWADSRFVTK